MKPSKAVIWLAVAVAVLAIMAAGIGLFWQPTGAPFTFVTLHGNAVDIYGRGIYADDTVFKSGANRGGDATTLFIAVPMLLTSLLFYCRGSLRGGLFVLGTLTHFLYVYATLAVGAAYNALFLVYVVIFGCSFYAWMLLIGTIQPLTAHFPIILPYRRIGLFLLTCGLLTGVLWLQPILNSFVRNIPPLHLGHATTLVTEALDLAMIVPACFVAGILLLRCDRRGLIFALPVLALLFFTGPSIVAMTAFQLADGIRFTVPEIVGPIGGFLVLGVINFWVLAAILRAVPQRTPVREMQSRQTINSMV